MGHGVGRNRPRSRRIDAALMTPTSTIAEGRDMSLRIVFFVALGGAIGSVARLIISFLIERAFHAPAFSTALINTVGCVALGFLVGSGASNHRTPEWHAFFATGLLGGFTTFSAFVGHVLAFGLDRHFWTSATYVVAQLFSCILGIVLGHRFGATF